MIYVGITRNQKHAVACTTVYYKCKCCAVCAFLVKPPGDLFISGDTATRASSGPHFHLCPYFSLVKHWPDICVTSCLIDNQAQRNDLNWPLLTCTDSNVRSTLSTSSTSSTSSTYFNINFWIKNDPAPLGTFPKIHPFWMCQAGQAD